MKLDDSHDSHDCRWLVAWPGMLLGAMHQRLLPLDSRLCVRKPRLLQVFSRAPIGTKPWVTTSPSAAMCRSSPCSPGGPCRPTSRTASPACTSMTTSTAPWEHEIYARSRLHSSANRTDRTSERHRGTLRPSPMRKSRRFGSGIAPSNGSEDLRPYLHWPAGQACSTCSLAALGSVSRGCSFATTLPIRNSLTSCHLISYFRSLLSTSNISNVKA